MVLKRMLWRNGDRRWRIDLSQSFSLTPIPVPIIAVRASGNACRCGRLRAAREAAELAPLSGSNSIPFSHSIRSQPPVAVDGINGGCADGSRGKGFGEVSICRADTISSWPWVCAGKENAMASTVSELSEKKAAVEYCEGAEGSFHGAVRTAETVLRVMPMGLCVAAMAVMLTNSQSTDEYGAVTYSDLTGFRYLVYADGVCAAYSLLSAVYTAATSRCSCTLRRAWTLFFLDQVLTYVVLAAGAVAAEILYLARNGDDRVTWSRVCGMFGAFCSRATASAGATFGAAACYVGLSLVSSYRLFSAYSAPIPFPSKGVEVAALPFHC